MYVLKKDQKVLKREKKLKDVKDMIVSKELKKDHHFDVSFDTGKKGSVMTLKPKSILKKEGVKSEKKKKVRIVSVPQKEREKIIQFMEKKRKKQVEIHKKEEINEQRKKLKKKLTKLKTKIRYNQRMYEKKPEKKDYYGDILEKLSIKEQDLMFQIEDLKQKLLK